MTTPTSDETLSADHLLDQKVRSLYNEKNSIDLGKLDRVIKYDASRHTSSSAPLAQMSSVTGRLRACKQEHNETLIQRYTDVIDWLQTYNPEETSAREIRGWLRTGEEAIEAVDRQLSDCRDVQEVWGAESVRAEQREKG